MRKENTLDESGRFKCHLIRKKRNSGENQKMNITWDADKYSKNFSFVHRYGNDVAELIDCKPGGTIVDLGCGNGALTNIIKNKGYKVIGIDASDELLDLARRNYPDIDFVQADATSFSLKQPADVVFSNAVFHWIDKEKQPLMLDCVNRALKENGQFVFEFGGQGNNALIHGALENAFNKYGYSYKFPFYFPSIGEYASMLERAGFLVKYAVLFERPTELTGERGLKDWINMFVKRPFEDAEITNKREEIIDAAVESLKKDLYRNGKWYADYVRIRMTAYKC